MTGNKPEHSEYRENIVSTDNGSYDDDNLYNARNPNNNFDEF
jgi:hypothetical protein